MQKLKGLSRYYAIKNAGGEVIVMNPATKKEVPLQTNDKDGSKYWRLTDDDGKQVKIQPTEIENYFAGELEKPAEQPPIPTSATPLDSGAAQEAARKAHESMVEAQAKRDAEKKAREEAKFAEKAKRDQEKAEAKVKKDAEKAEAKAIREAERLKPKEKVSVLNHFTMPQTTYDRIMGEIAADPRAEEINKIVAGDLANDTITKNGKVRAMLAIGAPHNWIQAAIKVWPAYVHNVKKAAAEKAARDKYRAEYAAKRAAEDAAKKAQAEANGNSVGTGVAPEAVAQ